MIYFVLHKTSLCSNYKCVNFSLWWINNVFYFCFSENPLEIINCNNSYNLFSSVVDHPIEELHSLCYALHWRLPAYQFIEGPQDSLTVKLTYTVGCIIFTVKAIGKVFELECI